MATFSITTTAAQDAAVTRYVDQLNAANPTNPTTALQWARGFLFAKLDALVAHYRDTDNVSKAEAYQLASAEDKAAIDAILAKYQVP